MCLAVPALLMEQKGDEGVVDLHGNRVPVNTLLVPEAQVGDWLLVHAGFAIERLEEEEAQATWAVLKELDEAVEEADDS